MRDDGRIIEERKLFQQRINDGRRNILNRQICRHLIFMIR